jgi:hypothetical protein
MRDACGRPVVYRSMNRSTSSRTPPMLAKSVDR